MLVFLAAGFGAAPALAQEDDQAYKKAFNDGLEAYRAKNVNEAYTHWTKAADLAKQADDQDVATKALNYVSQIDYARGIGAYKQGNHEEALQHFDKGLEHDASFDKHHYGKGLALKELERFDEAIAEFALAAESSDRKVAETAENAIRNHYVFLASSTLAQGGENPTRRDAETALGYLTQLEEHVAPDADVHYYRAEAHKALGNYDQALEAANAGLEAHRGSRTDKAKLYFVKGEVLMFMNNNTAAAEAFREARYGSFKAPAEHYLETLGTGSN